MAKAKTAARPRAASEPVDIEIVDGPVNDDQQLVSADTTKLREFMGGLVRFFTTAVALEKKAKEKLDIARQLKPPTTADADAKVQIAIRDSKMTRKEIDEHWAITSVIHGLHRKLTAARERAGLMADEAATTAQKLHNRYVEDEKRKADQENERLRREAEDRARADREREQEQLEQEALKAEAKSPELSEREALFVDATIRRGQRPTQAAESAGFKNPAQAGERLMNTPKITAALDAARRAAAIREQAAAKREMPIEVEVETVKPNITRATPGGFDRSTWSGEILDERVFIEAVIGGKHGIPADALQINPAKLNEYARSMHELIDRWPGVRAKKNTTTV